jgi:hypothetical protein
VIQCQSMEPPRVLHQLVRPIYGVVVQTWYVWQHLQHRWAFAEEDAGRCKWLVFYTWSGAGGVWEERIIFRTLKHPRRGRRVDFLHGRRRSISYSQDLKDQLVLVIEECDGVRWWVFYVEGPDQSLIHMISLQVNMAPVSE